MTPEESLLNFGTIVFSKDFMLRTINFGEPIMNGPEFMGFNRVANPSSLCLTVWLASGV